MRIAPFRAVRYRPEVAGPPLETSAPPYGDLDRFDYAAHRTANPYTVLELMTAEAGPTTARRYAGARATLDRWLRTGVLAQDDVPSMSVYAQQDPASGHVQEGVVATIDVGDSDKGDLLLHEHVDRERTLQRAARLVHVPVDLTPIVAVHLGAPDTVAATVAAATAQQPTVEFADEAGVTHRLWTITQPTAIATITTGLADVTALIADGHHRIAAARQVATDQSGAPDHDAGGFSRTLALILDATHHGPQLRAIHRLVRSSRPDLPQRLAGIDTVSVTPWTGTAEQLAESLVSGSARSLGLVTRQGAWRATFPADFGQRLLTELAVPQALSTVDMVALRHVIFPVMGVYDDEPMADVSDTGAALDQHLGDAVVLLAPPRVSQVLDIARRGERMPAKTTWFWPKPRAGLVMRRIDDNPATFADDARQRP